MLTELDCNGIGEGRYVTVYLEDVLVEANDTLDVLICF